MSNCPFSNHTPISKHPFDIRRKGDLRTGDLKHMYIQLAKLRAMAGKITNLATMKDSCYGPPYPPMKR